jgi:hypothetical protein
MANLPIPLGKYKVSSERLASIAGKGINHPDQLSDFEVQVLAASVLSQAKKPVETK